MRTTTTRQQQQPSAPKQNSRDVGVVDFTAPSLCLSHSGLTGPVCLELCRGLAGLESLTSLDLSHNPDIGDDGAEAIAAMLAQTPSLTSLSVSHCSISDWGVVCLTRGARRHHTLAVLDLSSNPFGDAGLNELSRFVAQDTAITELVMTDTHLTLQGALLLAEAMISNGSLLYVSLPFSVGFPLLHEVDKLLRRNWMRRNGYDQRVALATILVKSLDATLRKREERLRCIQPCVEPPMSRIRHAPSNGATIEDWRDDVVAGPLMCLALLDKRSQSSLPTLAELSGRSRQGGNQPAGASPVAALAARYGGNFALQAATSRARAAGSNALPMTGRVPRPPAMPSVNASLSTTLQRYQTLPRMSVSPTASMA